MAYDPENVFAKILKGKLPCVKVCEDSNSLVIMDAMPQADGHVLIITKEPASTIFELSADGFMACTVMTRRIAIAVTAALDAPGIMIAQLNGADSGQTVPHVHFHVIPRTSGVPLKAHAATPEDSAKLKILADRIIAALPLP